MIIREALKEAMARFESADVPSSGLAAELLLMRAMQRDRAWLYAHAESALDTAEEREFLAFIEQRAAGMPTQYLTGCQEFWGIEFEVGPGFLIPRPETEHLIEVTLERLGSALRLAPRPALRNEPLRIADVGTGSGCIAVALAMEFPAASIVATDNSSDALEIARRNAAKHGVERRINFLQANLIEGAGASSEFHAVVSNPPYIPQDEAAALPREVRDHEPAGALFGGPDGLGAYRDLIAQAAVSLKSGGLLVLELGHDSCRAVRELLDGSQQWQAVQVTNDLAGIPRVISAIHVGS